MLWGSHGLSWVFWATVLLDLAQDEKPFKPLLAELRSLTPDQVSQECWHMFFELICVWALPLTPLGLQPIELREQSYGKNIYIYFQEWGLAAPVPNEPPHLIPPYFCLPSYDTYIWLSRHLYNPFSSWLLCWWSGCWYGQQEGSLCSLLPLHFLFSVLSNLARLFILIWASSVIFSHLSFWAQLLCYFYYSHFLNQQNRSLLVSIGNLSLWIKIIEQTILSELFALIQGICSTDFKSTLKEPVVHTCILNPFGQ